MTEVEVTPNGTPVILHEGRYKLWRKPDGTLRLQYRRDDKDEDDFLEIPGAMLRLAQMASEGNMSFPQFIKEAAKLRRELYRSRVKRTKCSR